VLSLSLTSSQSVAARKLRSTRSSRIARRPTPPNRKLKDHPDLAAHQRGSCSWCIDIFVTRQHLTLYARLNWNQGVRRAN
jgi:hypothetical protein